MRKWNNDNLKIYVEKESDCEFLGYRVREKGKRKRIILRLKCGCDAKTEFEVLLDGFSNKKSPKDHCIICSKKMFVESKRIPYITVKNYIEGDLGNGCILITTEEDYISARDKLDIKCKCGNEFKCSFDVFKQANKRQCNPCGTLIYIEKNTMTNEQFIERVYSEVQEEYTFLEEYKGGNTKIKVRHNCDNCNNHEYAVSPSNFLFGTRCPVCTRERTNKLLLRKEVREKCIAGTVEACRLSQEFVFNEFDKIGLHVIEGQTYTGDTQHIKYICEKHPKVIQEKTYGSVRNGKGCPLCHKSKGEKKIREFFISKNINFKEEYIFRDLTGIKGGFLRFDFAIFKDKEKTKFDHLLEFDGLQHFIASTRMGGDEKFVYTQAHDILKNEYCEKNGIKLVRIDYKHLNTLEKELDIMYMDFNKEMPLVI